MHTFSVGDLLRCDGLDADDYQKFTREAGAEVARLVAAGELRAEPTNREDHSKWSRERSAKGVPPWPYWVVTGGDGKRAYPLDGGDLFLVTGLETRAVRGVFIRHSGRLEVGLICPESKLEGGFDIWVVAGTPGVEAGLLLLGVGAAHRVRDAGASELLAAVPFC
jgi:hypothetical protein